MRVTESLAVWAAPGRARGLDRDQVLTARFVREVIPPRDTLRRRAFCLSRNHSDAEDLVQETMLKAYAASHSFRPETNLLRILINSYINHYRKARHHLVLYSTEKLADQYWATFSSRPPAAGLHSASTKGELP